MENCEPLTHQYFKSWDSLDFSHKPKSEWDKIFRNYEMQAIIEDKQLFPLNHSLRQEKNANGWIQMYFSWGCKDIQNNPQRMQILLTLYLLQKTFPHLPSKRLYVCNGCKVLQQIPVNTDRTCWACNQVCGGYPHWQSVNLIFRDDKFTAKEHRGDCIMCLEEMKEGDKVVKFPADGCKHEFHSECLANYMTHSQDLKCPVCVRPCKLKSPGYIGTKNWTDEDLMLAK